MTGRARPFGNMQWLMLLILIGAAQALAAAVNAELDRGRVYEGDVFTLSIENTGQQGGTPDLSPLNQDFEVLSTGTSNSFSFVNGRSSSRSSWTVKLRARRVGTLQIPPITVGSEQTRALTIEVSEVPETPASQQSPHAFIEVELAPKGPVYVQQQLVYTVRLYQGERVTGGELSEPHPPEALVERLGSEQRYTAERNGRRYRVTERNYAIAVQQSGELRIPPLAFRGRLAPPPNSQGQGSLRDRFFGNSPFANDPFFSQGRFGNSSQPLRVSSNAVTITVQPPPATIGAHWLPAETLELHDSWADQPPALRSGEPVTRVITVRAKGLTGAQLPALTLTEPGHTRVYAGARANDTRSDGNAVYGISRQTFTYMPARSGRLTIPAFELGWWNTTTGEAETARLPRWDLEVAAGSAPAAGPSPNLQTFSGDADAGRSRVDAPTDAEGAEGVPAWPLVVLLLIGAAVALLIIVRRHGPAATTAPRAPAPSAIPAPAEPEVAQAPATSPSLKQLQTELASACQRNAPTEAAHALLMLARNRWPDTPPTNLRDLAQRLGRAESVIDALERALYAPDAGSWDGATAWQVLQAVDWSAQKAAPPRRETGLQPLYPQKT